MARKVVNRKALREANDAAEAIEAKEKASGKAAKEPKEKAAPKKKKTKEPEIKAVKLFWGVFKDAKQIALFEYSQKKQADAKAAELTEGGKGLHFVQKVKREVATTAE